MSNLLSIPRSGALIRGVPHTLKCDYSSVLSPPVCRKRSKVMTRLSRTREEKRRESANCSKMHPSYFIMLLVYSLSKITISFSPSRNTYSMTNIFFVSSACTCFCLQCTILVSPLVDRVVSIGLFYLCI